jgi:hypothetical protein
VWVPYVHCQEGGQSQWSSHSRERRQVGLVGDVLGHGVW